jgi:hypothetical protein
VASVISIEETGGTQMAEILRNYAIKLRRDEPMHDPETPPDGLAWRCDIWLEDGGQNDPWPLFATAWGRTSLEARAKANSIVQACERPDWRPVSEAGEFVGNLD